MTTTTASQLAYVRQLPSGKWQVRTRADSGRLVSRGTHGTEVDAKIAAATLAQDVRLARIESALRGEPVTRGRAAVLFRDYAAQWAAGDTGQLATREAKASHARLLSAHFGDRAMADITTADVRAFLMWMAAQPGRTKGTLLASGTRRQRFISLRSIFSAAVAADVVPTNPTDGVSKPMEKRKVARLVTRAEFDAISAFLPDRWRLFFSLERYAGLRFNEVPALTPSDIRNGAVVIHKTVDLSATVRPYTKTGGQRSVPLLPRIAVAVAEHIDRYSLAPGDLLTTTHGGFIWYKTAAAIWTKACEQAIKAGTLDGSLRIPTQHDLRHSFATDCVHAGVPVFMLQAWLGHARLEMTERYYQLAPSGAQHDAMALVDKLAQG